MTDELFPDETLEAYASGRLPAAEAARVETFLASHPEASGRVAAWTRQNEALRALFGPVALEPVPPRLDPRRLAAARRAGTRRLSRLAAAATVLLGLGIGLGWTGHAFLAAEGESDRLIDTAVAAHALYVRESRHAVEVAASDREHLLTWLSNRIGSSFGAPDLAPQGFSLVGGRLLPAGAYAQSGPAAQLMYENAAAERVTVFITGRPPAGEATYRSAEVEGLDVVYWADDAITCTVIAGLPDAEIEPLARRVFQQLTQHPDRAPERG